MLKVVLLGSDVRRDGTFVLDYFSDLEFHIFYRTQPYNDHRAAELNHPRLHHFRWATVLDQLRALKPDVIVSGADAFCLAHWPRFWRTWLLARTLKVRWVPFVLENRPLKIRYGRALGGLTQLILSAWFRSAWFVMSGNHGAAQIAQQCGVPAAKLERLLFSNWGVDIHLFRPHASKKSDVPTILFVGRWVLEKGLIDTVGAVRAAARELGKPLRLWLVGDGPLRPWLSEQIAACALDSVDLQLMGSVPNSDLPRLFGSAWLCMSPSKTVKKWAEQIGVVNFQSLACGTPVLSTRSGAIPEFLSETGAGAVLVDEGDIPGMIDVLKRYITQPEFRQQLEREARSFALQYFDARKNVKRFEQMMLCRSENKP